jgi:hypothetical protein
MGRVFHVRHLPSSASRGRIDAPSTPRLIIGLKPRVEHRRFALNEHWRIAGGWVVCFT